MSAYLSDSAIILVAVMPETRDLEIARLLGWYRIPLRFAPKVIDVDYLAFYQTARFGGEHRWRVEWFSELRGHELTTRRELFRDAPDHPRAGEEYYKLQLGPLQNLPQPILAEGWKRITFLYTVGAYFNRARTITDLVVRSEEREVLWHSLRERAQRGGSYQSQELSPQLLDPALLALFGEFQNLRFGPDQDDDVERNDRPV
ncbi:MAG: hypothetical protein VB089_12355 [Anaerolineaceae bacterium]|nr:hypothetical protein [Anaerolineaceae bacterium]